MKVLFKTGEHYISFDMGYVRALDLYRFFHPRGLDAISKTLKKEECITSNIYVLEKRMGIFPYEWLDCVDKLNKTQIPYLF